MNAVQVIADRETGKVVFGDVNVGAYAMDPEAARHFAMRLLVEADLAEGKFPSHIYQVDAR